MAAYRPRFDKDRWNAVSAYLDRVLDMPHEEARAFIAALREQNPIIGGDLAELLAERRAVDDEGFLEQRDLLSEQTSLAGELVGAYRLIAPIGHGGMGTVWLAERFDGRFEARAAVKLLNPSLMDAGIGGQARHTRAEERFRREGRLLGRLTHPNIARLLDAGVSSAGQPYLVLEYVDGHPIDAYCDAHALGVEARIRLFLDVLSAVAHAHQPCRPSRSEAVQRPRLQRRAGQAPRLRDRQASSIA
jgi:eukaryotic-like serine/threonine-protein kinase